MKKEKKHYLSNKDLYCEIIVSKALGRLTPRAAQMLMLLGKKLQSKMFYANQDDKKDCLQEAMMSAFSNWHNFDELKGQDAFAYYSEIIKRGLAKGWNKINRTKGDENAVVISLDGYDSEGKKYERF